MKRILVLIGALTLGGVEFSPAFAQAEGAIEKSSDDLESILQRMEDIKRRRRNPDPTAASVAGASEDAGRAVSSAGGWGLIVWALGIAAAIFAVAVIVRWYRPPDIDEALGRALEVKESMWLGRGQRLVLIRVRSREILLGASGGQLTSLAVLSADDAVVAPSDQEEVADADEELPRLLNRKAQRKTEAERFAGLVQEELTAAAGTPPMSKQQILRRLNSL